MNSPIVNNLFILAGRFLMSLIFIMAGINKINAYAGTQGYMESVGLPGILLPAVILLELGGGILLLIGWNARISAFLLAGFTLLAAFIFHFKPDDQIQMIMLMKNMAISGGLLFIVASGPGAWSLDRD